MQISQPNLFILWAQEEMDHKIILFILIILLFDKISTISNTLLSHCYHNIYSLYIFIASALVNSLSKGWIDGIISGDSGVQMDENVSFVKCHIFIRVVKNCRYRYLASALNRQNLQE